MLEDDLPPPEYDNDDRSYDDDADEDMEICSLPTMGEMDDLLFCDLLSEPESDFYLDILKGTITII